MVGEGPQSGSQVASHSCVSWLHRWRNLSRAELLPIRHAEVIPDNPLLISFRIG